jgi:peptidoglycan/xylan/chitin deacetylase (PgdA/CDA1 family)
MAGLWEVPRDLLLGRYPPFVTGGPLPQGHIPVFVFHSLEPHRFARQLTHLADNGYVTLSADEYAQILLGGRPAPARAVVLTFDDGRGSLWSVGYPLLRRFGMRGIVFLVPARMLSRPGPPAPTWDDVREGRLPPEAVLAREEGDGAFLSWEEVRALARAGVYDFQSHTLTHSRIHTGPQVAGFMTPRLRRGYDAMDVPLIGCGDGEGHRDLLGPEVPLGTPLLRSAARTSEALRFHEEPAIREECVAAVARSGEAFFADEGWERTLRALVAGRTVAGRFEAPEERERALRRELAEARTRIEEHTGVPAVHLCYPWHESGPTARWLAREAGYRTAFCGKVPGTPITVPGGDLLAIARLGEDYLELLPGRGRSSLTDVLRAKWRRRRAAPA